MKILVITEGFFIEPLGIMQLSGCLKKAGHETDLITTEEDYESKIKEWKPKIIAYSVMTGNHKIFVELNNKLKRKFDFISLFGGPHATFFKDLIEEDGVDVVCMGEGDEAIVELANKLDKNEDIKNINNLNVKKDGVVYRNSVRSLIEDLDSLPFPDRDIVMKYDKIKNDPIKHFVAGRGCPFNCKYCFNEKYAKVYEGKGKRVRWRSVDNLIEEIKEVNEKYPTKVNYFQDDTFILDKEWLREFCEKYKEINLPFHCHVRANLVDEEIVKMLKEANCYSVHIAAETADDKIRNEVLNRNMSKEDILNACKLLRKHKIKFMMQNMIGLPGGSLKKDIETLKLNIKCKPTYAWVSIFQPYPGTELEKYCRENGYVEDLDYDDIGSNFYERSLLKIDDRKKIEHLQKWFAYTVDNPYLYYSGLLKVFISFPKWKGLNRWYKGLYQNFRDKKDNDLFGVSLK